MKVAIIDYGAGNICSVIFALQRLGIDPIITNNSVELQSADRVIFPGVGHAKSAIEQLRITELNKVVPLLKMPVLGICLGMQLLCKHSAEGEVDGLGIFDASVKRFDTSEKIPHMGWNTIEQLKSPLFKGIANNSYMYFVHSYAVSFTENTIAKSHYGRRFSAALKKENFYGCQFHPEKSGKLGQQILINYINL